jgi:hypothetical protein
MEDPPIGKVIDKEGKPSRELAFSFYILWIFSLPPISSTLILIQKYYVFGRRYSLVVSSVVPIFSPA